MLSEENVCVIVLLISKQSAVRSVIKSATLVPTYFVRSTPMSGGRSIRPRRSSLLARPVSGSVCEIIINCLCVRYVLVLIIPGFMNNHEEHLDNGVINPLSLINSVTMYRIEFQLTFAGNRAGSTRCFGSNLGVIVGQQLGWANPDWNAVVGSMFQCR